MLSSPESAVMICSTAALKTNKRKVGSVFKSMFGIARPGVVGELETEQVHQIMKTALYLDLMCSYDPFVRDMFHVVFVEKDISPSYIARDRLLNFFLVTLGARQIRLCHDCKMPLHPSSRCFSSVPSRLWRTTRTMWARQKQTKPLHAFPSAINLECVLL